MHSSLGEFLSELGGRGRVQELTESIGRPIKQRAIFRHNPLESIEYGANALQIGHFSPGNHQQPATGSKKSIKFSGGFRVHDSVMSERAVVIAGETTRIHSGYSHPIRKPAPSVMRL